MMDPLEAMVRGAVKRGEFTLSSGKTSDFYFDGKELSLRPEGSVLIAERFCDWLTEDKPDAFGGPAVGACALVSATGVLAAQRGLEVGLFYVRKEAKGYGTGGKLVGPPLAEGSTAILCEDVVTTGGSLIKAVEAVRELGVTVARCYVLVDRDEGAREACQAAGIELRAVYRRSEL